MGFLDLMTRGQREEAQNLTGTRENPEARVDTLEEFVATVNRLQAGIIGELNALDASIKSTKLEIEGEREAAAEAINRNDLDGYRAHIVKRQQAEDALTAYQLRLEAIRDTAVIPKEDIVALINSARKIQEGYIEEAYKDAAFLIGELEGVGTELAWNLNEINEAITALERRILRGDDLYFENEKGGRIPVSLMFGSVKNQGTALFMLIKAIRNHPAYTSLTGVKIPRHYRDQAL